MLGLVYVSFGNVRDLQPWHGWLFEIDLDAWQAQAQNEIDDAGDGVNPTDPVNPITGTLVTTAAEGDCGAEDSDGPREMACGGGIWAARGPEVIADPASPDGYALLVATGNGLTRSHARQLRQRRASRRSRPFFHHRLRPHALRGLRSDGADRRLRGLL